MNFQEFIPKSLLCLRKDYSWAIFKKDLFAGITVGVIALPLAMAFAIASGVEPARGLFTAIIAGFLISALGGSRVQIGGPTGAFVVIVYDIVQRTGYEGLCIATLIGAVLLVLFGFFRLGSFIKYVPHSLVIGFTSGIALLIFTSQIKEFFGFPMTSLPSSFGGKWIAYFSHLPSFDLATLLLSTSSFAIILALRRFTPAIPWGITTIAFASLITYFFHLPVQTIASRFGEIPSALPTPTLPSFSLLFSGHLKELLLDGVAIALLGGIESLLSAVIGDGMIGGKHRSNCELIAQGVANFGSVLFGGIPATGAIARTATNIKTGAQTPLAGMIHSLTLFFFLLCLTPLVNQIPLFSLSVVLMMIAWNMSEAHHFIRLLKAPYGDRLVLLTSFFLTLFVDITAAIAVGMVVASFIFMQRMSKVSQTIPLNPLFPSKGVAVYDIQGPFFFGTASRLKDLSHPEMTLCILRFRSVPMIDASGVHSLQEFYKACQKKGIRIYLTEIQEGTKKDLHALGFLSHIQKDHLFATLEEALLNWMK